MNDQGLPNGRPHQVVEIDVERIRPEEGLGRKRDREGHLELQRSIEQFGVLTPVTVRAADDESGDYLLIKGQGRTLACRLLQIKTIPAVVVDEAYVETEKVQQFLVENVARLKMRPIERALLIQRARASGEETAQIAERFGVSPATVRRLLAQLEGASHGEVAALRAGQMNLSVHAIVTRHVKQSERSGVMNAVASSEVKARDLDLLFVSLDWAGLVELWPDHVRERLALIEWACTYLSHAVGSSSKERLRALSEHLPVALPRPAIHASAVP